MGRKRHRRMPANGRVSWLRIGATTTAAMAVVALAAYGLSAGAHTTTHLTSGLDAATSVSPSEGHSPRLTRELSGPLAGTGVARSGARMSATVRQATSTAASTMLNGIDISSGQHPDGAAIDWAEVHAAGYDFVGIKATEGNYYVNPYYKTDAEAAVAAGMYVAAYAFANPDNPKSTGADQAEYAVQNAGNYKVGGQYLPLALDIEYDPYSTNECYGITTSAMVSWISSFVEEATTLTGAAPIIYTPQDWWDACTGDSTVFGSDVLWIPAYATGTPGTLPAGWKTWTIWQYTSSAAVSGISGTTDLDYFDGGPETEQSALGAPVSIPIRTLNSLAGQTVTYTATGLPPGVTISTDGLITGTPTQAGTYAVTVTPAAATAVLPSEVSFTWDVTDETVTPTSPGNLSTVAGSPVDRTMTATDSVSGYAPFTFAAKGLPAGLAISKTGTITGWPYTTGTYNVTVTATDTLGAIGTASFTWKISQAPDNGATGRVVLANGGKCLDDTGASTRNGTGIQIWTCKGDTAQKWTVVQDQTLRVVGKCLDESGTANGSAARLETCAGGDTSQRWRVATDGELVNIASGKCLDDTGRKTANGTKLDIWTCDGATNQRWTVPVVALESGLPGVCLDDKAGSTTNGNAIETYACDGATAEKWTITTGGTIRIAGKCLDVTGKGTASGTKVELWTCTSGDAAQTWTITGSGELVNPHSGKCLTDPGDSASDGTRAEIMTCPATYDPGTVWRPL